MDTPQTRSECGSARLYFATNVKIVGETAPAAGLRDVFPAKLLRGANHGCGSSITS
jgi:hypothetical protein